MASPVPPLLAVSLVFQAKTQFLDVPHLVDAVSVFVDTSVDVPPLQACKLGTVKLLDCIWNSSDVYTQGNNCVANVTFSFRRFLRTGQPLPTLFLHFGFERSRSKQKFGSGSVDFEKVSKISNFLGSGGQGVSGRSFGDLRVVLRKLQASVGGKREIRRGAPC
ncbi:hypothetical protein PR003_g1267 [Phytophthora rubi]|uniref:Uncharacterized protein n=1 Tax=Phytophthora rubi TaxID=129364 RepID=A0A6A4G8J3_9STRA|nr:hypothetical protein PR002_g3889 [Phytophthora rubi]KAE9048754.1 hypothetical protein PR001_g3702 [Phytophthora rubi]KAE9358465.1 hypothetical protein PR003_g1267 [Phytophthora rubi]